MDNQLNLIPSRNGELNIQYNGRVLYSRYNPSASADRLAGNTVLSPRTIYLIPSPLLAYGFETLLKMLPEDSLILGVETDQSLMALTSPYINKYHQKGRCEIYRLDDSVSLYRIFNNLPGGLYRSCRLLPLNSGYQLNREKYDLLFSALEHFLQNFWQNRLTAVKLGKLWMKNLISNLAYPGGKQISRFKTEKAVILAGAGESLERSLPLMKEGRENLFILAVDTALQTLIRSGILPDAVVNLEAQFHNLMDFYSLGETQIRQFADMTAYPASLRRFKGEKYFFSSRFGTCGLTKRLQKNGILPPEIPALGSVGVTALYVAGEITDAPIFLTGLDFSYVPGKSHAKESPFHDWCRLRENRLQGDAWYSLSASRPGIQASGKDNSPYLQTNAILMSYGRQLGDMCLLMDQPVYDLSEIGLDLQIPRISAEEALDTARSHLKENTAAVTGENRFETSERNRLIRDLLTEEYRRLSELTAAWESVNRGEAEPESLLPLLKYCDYIYYHFPDRENLPHTEPSFLVRAVRSGHYYKRLIEAVLKETDY